MSGTRSETTTDRGRHAQTSGCYLVFVDRYWERLSYVLCLVSCLVSCVRCLMSCVWCLVSCLVSCVRCLVLCLVSGVLCLVSCVWCIVETDRGVFVCVSGVIVYLIDTYDFPHGVRRNPCIRELCLRHDVYRSFCIVGCEVGPVPMASRCVNGVGAVSNRSKYRLPEQFTHSVMQLQLVEYLGVVSYQC